MEAQSNVASGSQDGSVAREDVSQPIVSQKKAKVVSDRKPADERAAAFNVFECCGQFVNDDEEHACKYVAQGIIGILWGDVPMSWSNIVTGLYTCIRKQVRYAKCRLKSMYDQLSS